ncbi:DUF1361 domain-containing protein [Enterococcus pingfangensis]|uniref:DUF1361 domain-containing protein n=1 Tax=Enterococcus pingfangensis TaxID=2559924 RepID=UPI0010F6006C|nr:DUF1361 domain-containing protein [Enterococcus pingfangensis]
MKKVAVFHISVLIYILFMYFTQETFSFMGLNVFLAWLPLIFGRLFLRVENKWRFLFIPLWLLFFPNIPYLLTDLFHLASLGIYQSGGHFLNATSDWWAYLTLVLPIVVMVFIGMAQVFKLLSASKLSVRHKIASFVILAFLASVAIYIGRFERIHSIELLIHPLTVLKLLVIDWNVAKVQFVLLFSILQLGIWGLIYFLRRDSQEE